MLLNLIPKLKEGNRLWDGVGGVEQGEQEVIEESSKQNLKRGFKRVRQHKIRKSEEIRVTQQNSKVKF